MGNSPGFLPLALTFAVFVPVTMPGLAQAAGTKAVINSDLVLEVNGKEVFPIGFTVSPPPDGKTPEGKNALQELAEAGGTFLRTGAAGGDWDDRAIANQKKWLDAAARRGMYCWVYLAELAAVGPGDKGREAVLQKVARVPVQTLIPKTACVR